MDGMERSLSMMPSRMIEGMRHAMSPEQSPDASQVSIRYEAPYGRVYFFFANKNGVATFDSLQSTARRAGNSIEKEIAQQIAQATLDARKGDGELPQAAE